MSGKSNIDIGAAMLEGSAVDRANARARADLVELHRKLGLPLVIWRDGRVVWVSAHEVDLDED